MGNSLDCSFLCCHQNGGRGTCSDRTCRRKIFLELNVFDLNNSEEMGDHFGCAWHCMNILYSWLSGDGSEGGM